MPSDIADPQTDNEALRRILLQLESLVGFLLGDSYDTVSNEGSDTHTATTDAPYARADDQTVQKTVVTNLSINNIYVKEAGVIVAVLSQYETWVSDLSGFREITVVPVSSSVTGTFAIASYKKTV